MMARSAISFAAVLVACSDDAGGGAEPMMIDGAVITVEDGSFATARPGDAGGSIGMASNDAAVVDASAADAAQPVARRLADRVTWLGRADLSNPDVPVFAWSGSGFEAHFTGTGLRMRLENRIYTLSEPPDFMFRAVVDGVPQPPFAAGNGARDYVLASNLPRGEHTVALHRQSEGVAGPSLLLSLSVDNGELLAPIPHTGRLIEVVGDSISCGYGNLGTSHTCTFSFATESHWDTYGAIAARALDADLSTVAASGYGMYRDYGGTSSNLMPPLYERTVPDGAITSFSDRHPNAIVINLGTNDFAQGDPGPSYANAYTLFVDSLRLRHPHALIVCAMGPMLNDPEKSIQRSYLRNIVQTRRSQGDDNIDFLELTQQTQNELGCDWHPNVSKHEQMADQLAHLLRTRLTW